MKLSIEELKEILSLAEKYEYKPDEWHRKNLANSCGSDEIISIVRELIAIRELKGEQVPVAEVHDRAGLGVWLTQHGKQLNLPNGTQLFTALQKPVVSRIDFESYYSGIMGTPMSVLKVLRNGDSYSETEGERLSLSWSAYQAAIEAAGSIVKEPTNGN